VLCHVYDGVMSVLSTPLQIKCYPSILHFGNVINVGLNLAYTFTQIFQSNCSNDGSVV